MIKKINTLPDLSLDNIENFKIKSDFKIYPDTTAVYKNETGGLLSFSPGSGCVIAGKWDDELTSFLNLLNPSSIYCSESIADIFCFKEYKKIPVNVMKTVSKVTESGCEAEIKSDEAYKILKSAEDFLLPPYEFFAVDFCRRKNNGGLVARAIKDIAFAEAFVLENTALISGIVSKQKGEGSRVLKNLLGALYGKTVFAAVEDKNVPFYLKNGFDKMGNAAYFIKR